MIKIIALVAGVAGACVLSQTPEFSQQYQQRLAGQVDALTTFVLDFDASALEAGLGREEALAQMVGTPFLEARQVDMRRTFARHAVLSEALFVLRDASPVQKVVMPLRHADAETFGATWADFAPAVPLTVAGVVSAAVGGLLGWLAGLSMLSLCALPFRRMAKSRPAQPATRREPAVMRPALAAVTDDPRPRLMGATR